MANISNVLSIFSGCKEHMLNIGSCVTLGKVCFCIIIVLSLFLLFK